MQKWKNKSSSRSEKLFTRSAESILCFCLSEKGNTVMLLFLQRIKTKARFKSLRSQAFRPNKHMNAIQMWWSWRPRLTHIHSQSIQKAFTARLLLHALIEARSLDFLWMLFLISHFSNVPLISTAEENFFFITLKICFFPLNEQKEVLY